MSSEHFTIRPLDREPQSQHTRRCGLRLFAMAVFLFSAGCGSDGGPQRHPVSGRVLLDGVPLPAGTIRFIPIGPRGGPAAFTRVTSGLFALSAVDGPVAGLHRVEIEAAEFHNFAIDDEAAFATAWAKTGRSPCAMNPIPERYNVLSRLTAEIADGENPELLFHLSSKR